MLSGTSVAYTSVPQDEDGLVTTTRGTPPLRDHLHETHTTKDCYIAAGAITFIIIIVVSVATILTVAVGDEQVQGEIFNNNMFSSGHYLANSDYKEVNLTKQANDSDSELLSQGSIELSTAGSSVSIASNTSLEELTDSIINSSPPGVDLENSGILATDDADPSGQGQLIILSDGGIENNSSKTLDNGNVGEEQSDVVDYNNDSINIHNSDDNDNANDGTNVTTPDSNELTNDIKDSAIVANGQEKEDEAESSSEGPPPPVKTADPPLLVTTPAPTAGPSGDMSKEGLHNEEDINSIINEIYGIKPPKPGKPVAHDSTFWLGYGNTGLSMTETVLVIIGVILIIVLLVAGVTCIVKKRLNRRKRRINLQTVITDLQSRDKVVLLNSDDSDG